MSRKLKVMLPAFNVVMTLVLLGIGYMPPWTPLPGQVAYSINAPANLLGNLVWFEWDKHIRPHCSVAGLEACFKAERAIETAAFLFGIAFIWYVVGVEIEAGRRGTRAMARFGTLPRIFVDVIMLLAGALVVFMFVANCRILPLNLSSWMNFGIFFYLAWALVFVIPYGHDLVRIVGRLKGGDA